MSRFCALHVILFSWSQERLYDFVKALFQHRKKSFPHPHIVILSFEKVIFIDSSGIAKLKSLARECASLFDAKIFISSPSPEIKEMLTTENLDKDCNGAGAHTQRLGKVICTPDIHSCLNTKLE